MQEAPPVPLETSKAHEEHMKAPTCQEITWHLLADRCIPFLSKPTTQYVCAKGPRGDQVFRSEMKQRSKCALQS